MESLKKARERKGISQRNLARLAHISYKTIQLLESGRHDPKISTLQTIGTALGYPSALIRLHVEGFFSLPEDSIAVTSERIVQEGEDSWKTWLFNFVDAFRENPDRAYIEGPPSHRTSSKMKALLASTTETLCDEKGIASPEWCQGIFGLKEPWFVSGTENLKPMALVESPIHFRKRNIFVLGNFLERR